jgi:hypothetical protein
MFPFVRVGGHEKGPVTGVRGRERGLRHHGAVSKRRRLALIALVWIVAAVLCALPSVWPAYARTVVPAVAAESFPLGCVTGWAIRGPVRRR